MSTLTDAVRALIAQLALDARSSTKERLAELEVRLDEPLRVAFAGRVKAGKSTLLNAIVGVPIAMSDVAECTRFVTWYRYGTHPVAYVVDREGGRRRVPYELAHGIDVSGSADRQIRRLEVEYPSPALSSMTLIDTPGIASISEEVSTRATSFLVPPAQDQGADVLVYLLRFLHEQDTDFLEAFKDASARPDEAARSIGVLSRADELGGGRGDGNGLARATAARLGGRPQIRRQISDVFAVSGLIGLNAGRLRHDHFEAVLAIAALPLPTQDHLLLSVDRLRGQELPPIDRHLRAELVDLLGLAGVRVAVAMARRGEVPTADDLARRLLEHSGIEHIRRVLLERYAQRAEALKAAHALVVMRLIADDSPGQHAIAREIERIQADNHELAEITALNDLRILRTSDDVARVLRSREWDMVEAALGGGGLSLAHRTGNRDDTDGLTTDVISAADRRIDELRALEGVRLLPRRVSLVVQIATRSLETVRFRLVQGEGG